MGFDHTLCDTGLVLGLSLNSSPSMVEPSPTGSTKKPYVILDHVAKRPIKAMVRFEPSLTLGPSGHNHNPNKKVTVTVAVADTVVGEHGGLYRQDSVISGGGSSFSNVSVKREREVGSEESERVSNDNNYNNSRSLEDVEDDDGSVNGKKKLRLTKPQAALLEEAFRLHSSLNPKQKQELARELKLRPRQVEVWFQNRRARMKLKQTEMDYEHLKKCCEMLTDENRRLHKEVQELKTLKSSQPFYMQLPAATLTMCPSCERIGEASSPSNKIPFNMATKPHFFNSFTNQPVN